MCCHLRRAATPGHVLHPFREERLSKMQGLLPSHVHLQRHPVGAILVLVRPDAYDSTLKALPAAKPVHIPPHHLPVICMTAICVSTVYMLSLAIHPC